MCLLLSSCSDWLNVKPYDQILEDDVFSNESHMTAALNGLYISLDNPDLYARNLTYYTLELMGQRYHFSSGLSLANYQERTSLPYFKYSENKEDVKHLDAIFTKAYNVIRDVNYYIAKVEKTEGVVSDAEKKILLGEAIALRAFLHLDMLRLYGPPPTINPDGMSIPYYKVAGRNWEPFETNSEIITKILGDLDTASAMLKDDAVLTVGGTSGDGEDFFADGRNRRLNYFAVQALKARTLMYKGTSESIRQAGDLAKSLIENETFGEAFPWVSSSSELNADKAFSKEVIFGINVAEMYNDWRDWFSLSKSNVTANILPTATKMVDHMFNAAPFSESTDWRVCMWSLWSNRDYAMSTRYMEPSDTPSYLNFQGLVRKSEIYLIAAEAFQDEKYVNTIRQNRGLKLLAEELGSYELQDEIEKEYMKEFMGEGQMFYYYKRRGEDYIMGRAGSMITISDPEAAYAPLMPQSERER